MKGSDRRTREQRFKPKRVLVFMLVLATRCEAHIPHSISPEPLPEHHISPFLGLGTAHSPLLWAVVQLLLGTRAVPSVGHGVFLLSQGPVHCKGGAGAHSCCSSAAPCPLTSGQCSSVALSPHGKMIAVALPARSAVDVYECRGDWPRIKTLRGANNPRVNAVVFSPGPRVRAMPCSVLGR